MRIVSMIFVLITHASYLTLDPPSQADISTSLFDSLMRSLCESFTKVCVNAFILISGWYGISGKIGRFLELVFQALFISISIYIVLRVLGLTPAMGVSEWLRILLFKHKGYWFVRAYIVLYLFAPVLNTFVENTERKLFRIFIVCFYIVQTIYGFYNYGGWYAGGYSPLSFMGLYLLSRYMRLYPNRYTQYNKSIDILIYIVISVFTAVCSLALTYLTGKGGTVLFLYASPLMVLSSVYFFLFFTKLSFYSRFVNWVAASCFAVYLVHTLPFIYHPYYADIVRHWFDVETRYFFVLNTSKLIVLYFVLSVLFDKIRVCAWRNALGMISLLYKRTNKLER
ncbi:MAG: acyltransferase family protein [Prevotella sp.]|nr:acyltransferase family protein [Prevotella sp.]